MKLQQPDAAIFNLSSSAVSYPSSSSSSSSSSSMSKVFKLLQPLALELPAAASGIEPASSLHLKCFRSPKASSPNHHQHASRSGGTRWNPTEEQIRKLESLYRSGMRTPNAQQIEKITSELASHGRIEGKNVFYWFQNHKARERQKLKLKRNPALLRRRHSVLDSNSHSPEANSIPDAKACAPALDLDGRRTLKLFPLQPENINDGRLI